jgi:penicillin-binding protein 1B
MDEPKQFKFKREEYEPSNYRDHYMGEVHCAPRWRCRSMWRRSVSLRIGYGRVVDLARKAGLNQDILATPSMALGSYVATPLEMAGAYTMFANNGIYTKPRFINTVRSAAGGPAEIKDEPAQHRAMDAKVSYLMLDMLQEVIRSGTGAGARALGLTAPAAGKTGTSRDGWFAGFMSDLLCVVWVGFDDYHELELEGAQSALPIWTEFMKKAAAQSQYFARPFENAPAGVISVAIDPNPSRRVLPARPGVTINFWPDQNRAALARCIRVPPRHRCWSRLRDE